MPATMWRLTRQAAASCGSADDVFAGSSGSHLSLLYQGSRLGTVQGCASTSACTSPRPIAMCPCVFFARQVACATRVGQEVCLLCKHSVVVR